MVSGTLQIPAGFLVDRISVRAVLVGLLALGAAALTIASLASAFWLFVASFALLGLANTVTARPIMRYSPTGSRCRACPPPIRFTPSRDSRLGPGAGHAPLPGRRVRLARRLPGCRGRLLRGRAHARDGRRPGGTGCTAGEEAVALGVEGKAEVARPLAGDLVNFVFFMLLSLASGGVQNYSVVALGALRGTELVVANVALTFYLVMSAIGVLLGGYAALRSTRLTASPCWRSLPMRSPCWPSPSSISAPCR